MNKSMLSLGLAMLLACGLASAGPVNINTADAPTIAKELDGIGMARAEAIVEWRRRNGAFASLADLQKVKGVGPRILELNRANIRFSEPDQG